MPTCDLCNTCAGFQVWDTVQAICSYVRGMLSSQAIMHGIGVGQAVQTVKGWGAIAVLLHTASCLPNTCVHSTTTPSNLTCSRRPATPQAATAYGAVFLFAVRDLTGMIGGLVFAHLEVTTFATHVVFGAGVLQVTLPSSVSRPRASRAHLLRLYVPPRAGLQLRQLCQAVAAVC